jgi:hypothetical protein
VRSLLIRAARQSEDALSVCWQCVSLPQASLACGGLTTAEIHHRCRGLYEEKNPLMGTNASSLVMGHYNLEVEYMWLPPEAAAGVMRVVQFREPVERLRSLYNFMKGPVTLSNLTTFVQNYDTFNARLLRGKYGGKLEHFLGVNVAVVRACGHTCIEKLKAGVFGPREAVALAKQNLASQFEVVGTTERMGEFADALRGRFAFLAHLSNPDDVRAMHETDEAEKRAVRKMLGTASVKRLLAQSRSLQAELELYHYAQEVARVQAEEIRACSGGGRTPGVGLEG